MVIRYPKYISNFRFFTVILSMFKISYCKLVELTLPHHLVLGNCLAHKQNYLYLCFLIFPQGILLICALLLFLSGAVFPRMLCGLFNICWQVFLKRFFNFFLPVIASPCRAVLPQSGTLGSTSQDQFLYLEGRGISVP